MVKKYIGKKIINLARYKNKKRKKAVRDTWDKLERMSGIEPKKKLSPFDKYMRKEYKKFSKEYNKKQKYLKKQAKDPHIKELQKSLSLDEHKRKKYKPFTKEHLATFHKLEKRSDILKPKKIKRKKGEINIIALPPRKKMTGGLINPVIKGAIKRLKKKGKWPTKSPYAKEYKESKKTKTTVRYLGKKRTNVPKYKIPVFSKQHHSRSKYEKKMWAKMKKPALKEKKAQRIGGELITKTKIIPKILRQITKPADDYADFMDDHRFPKHKKLLSRFSKHVVGLKAPSKRLNKARQAINKLFRYRQQQQIKQSEIMRSGARKAAAGKGLSPKEIEEILPKSLRKPMKFKQHPQLRQGGLIKPKLIKLAKRGWGKIIR